MDIHCLVELGPVAGILAGVIAGAPHDRRQRVIGDEGFPGSTVIALLGVVEPALDILAGRAGVIARWQAIGVNRALAAPAAGFVEQATADIQGYRKWSFGGFVAHGLSSSSASSLKRRMLRSAISRSTWS